MSRAIQIRQNQNRQVGGGVKASDVPPGKVQAAAKASAKQAAAKAAKAAPAKAAPKASAKQAAAKAAPKAAPAKPKAAPKDPLAPRKRTGGKCPKGFMYMKKLEKCVTKQCDFGRSLNKKTGFCNKDKPKVYGPKNLTKKGLPPKEPVLVKKSISPGELLATRRLRPLTQKRLARIVQLRRERLLSDAPVPQYIKKQPEDGYPKGTVNAKRALTYQLIEKLAKTKDPMRKMQIRSALTRARNATCTRGTKTNPCDIGTKLQVWNKTANRTAGGIQRGDLAKIDGRIVYKAKSQNAEKNKFLQLWRKTAQKLGYLKKGVKPFQELPKKGTVAYRQLRDKYAEKIASLGLKRKPVKMTKEDERDEYDLFLADMAAKKATAAKAAKKAAAAKATKKAAPAKAAGMTTRSKSSRPTRQRRRTAV